MGLVLVRFTMTKDIYGAGSFNQVSHRSRAASGTLTLEGVDNAAVGGHCEEAVAVGGDEGGGKEDR